MKHLFTIVCICICANVTAQTCAPKGISTDPDHPVNPVQGGRINTFNYTATGWPLRTEYLVGDSFKASPFYSDNNSSIEHFYAPNDGVLDILPANGWELIKRDFGYQDDGQPSPEKARNPFIVLYNRYQGRLRVFVARYSQQNFNGATLTVKFSSDSPMQTSLLDMGTNIKALDAPFIKDQQINSVVQFPTGAFEWFYSDFQMSYDVCTCHYVSKLNISLTLSNSSTISLTGSSNGTITAIEDGAPTADQQSKGPASFGDLLSGAKSVSDAYKDGQKAKEDLLEAIGASESKASAATTANRKTGNNNLFAGLASNNFIKAGIGSIPYVSAALSVLDFFNGGGKTAPQQVTITPMMIRQSYVFSGMIKNDFPDYTTITFRTPGSKIGNSPISQYPYYDEVLGVFNLLTTPKINKKVAREGTRDEVLYTVTFTIADDIVYTLNPAAKLTIQELSLHAVMKDENGREVVKTFSGSKFTHSYQGTPTTVSPEILTFYVVLNLKRLDATATTQNILLSMRYPFTSVLTITKVNATRIQATTQVIDNFCTTLTAFPDRTYSYRTSPRFTSGYTGRERTEESLSDASLSLDIFPNESTGLVNIKYSTPDDGPVKITIIDFLGRVVQTFNASSLEAGEHSEQTDLSNNPSGIYHVVVQTTTNKKSARLVLK